VAGGDATLTEMKQNLAKEKYADVLKEIPKINIDYATARDAVVSMRTLKAAAENATLKEEVPKTVQEARHARPDALGRKAD
jgi:hypothetical protein